jgi:hypothetical protein
VLSQNVEHLQNEITSFENSRQKGCFVYHTQAIAMEGVCLTFSTKLDGKFATGALWKTGIILNFYKTSKLLFCHPKPLLLHSLNLLCDAIIKTHVYIY